MTLDVKRRHVLTIAEFCELTGEKPDTVRKRCERGVYRAKKVGSRWRIYASEVKNQWRR